MADPQQFDMVVIGAGPAGKNAALTAAFFGKKAVIVERTAFVGGAAVNTGTLPSKTLRETALAMSGLRTRNLYGVDLSLRREATVGELLYHERMVKSTEQAQMLDILARYGVPVVTGEARFIDPHTVRVAGGPGADDKVLLGDKVVIATGSAPVRPPLYPFDHTRVFDSDEIVEMDHVPKSLIVIGAGVIGSEYACTFAALGVQVDLVDGRDTLLPFLDLEVSQTLAQAMLDLGIKLHWKETVTACAVTDDGVRLTMSSGTELSADAVLVAAGRQSNTPALDPDAAGLMLAKRGLIPVNDHFQTNVPHIYAVGDVVGFPALASTSAEQGRVAASHAYGGEFYKVMSAVLPSGIYTIPEVGMAGETEGSLQGHGIDYVVGKALYSQNPRGKIIGDRNGYLKLLFRRADMKLLGVHAIGEQGTELVHIGMTVMLADGGVDLFMRSCYNYPTLGDLYKLAAHDALLRRAGRQMPADD